MQPQKIKSIKLPLSLAVSSCLLVACGTVSTQTVPVTTATPTIITPVRIIDPTAQVAPQEDVVTQPTNQPTNAHAHITPSTPLPESAILDAETLEVLEDLLEARDMKMVEGDILSVQQYGNLWDRLRAGYRMTQPAYNDRIKAQKNWFSSRQSHWDKVTARASRYLYYTVTEAERRNIPTELALLPIIESSYDPGAISSSRAAGLWQFIPSTGQMYNLKQTATYDGRRDIVDSTKAAYDFLTQLYNQFGSWELALAAYNAGPIRIQNAIDLNRRSGLPTDYWSLRLSTETMNYVPRFMAVAQIVANPQQHNVSLPAVANHTHFRTVGIGMGASLDDVSKITGIELNELQLLNPALLTPIIEGVAPNRVVIPDSVSVAADMQILALGVGGMPIGVQYSGYVQPNIQPTIQPNPPINNPVPSPQMIEQIPSTPPVAPQPIYTGEPPISREESLQALSHVQYSPPAQSPVPKATKTTQPTQIAKRPDSHMVRRGETLMGIASQYNLSLSQLADYNNISTDTKLRAKEKLWLVPGKVNKTAAKPIAKSQNYTVQSGDTLIGLATRMGVTTADIAALNSFGEKDNLIANVVIKVPANAKLPAIPSGSTQKQAKVGNQSTSKNFASTESYEVKKGDTLTALATRFEMSVADLAKINNISAKSRLLAGNVIKVPKLTKKYKVKSGDTLTGLASRYGISIEELAKMNNLKSNSKLAIKQELIVPNR